MSASTNPVVHALEAASESLARPSLYEALVAAGIAVDHHESDLYFPDTTEARAILDGYPLQKSNATRFTNQAPPNVGARWVDVPFAFDPFWHRAGLSAAREREKTIADGLRALAAAHSITFREPLSIDANGEFSLAVSNGTERDGSGDHCGQFGTLAPILARYGVRFGIESVNYCSPEAGWCRMNHFAAARMVRESEVSK